MDQLPISLKTPIVNANASMNILTPIEPLPKHKRDGGGILDSSTK